MRRNESVALIWLALCVSMPLLVGCGNDEIVGIAASGTVTVGDKPLSGAVVTLEPAKGTLGPNASAPVFDGKFKFSPDAGLRGGRYIVRVSMIPAELRESLPAAQLATMPASDAMIDPKFDANSTVDCELKSDAENVFQFTVEFL